MLPECFIDSYKRYKVDTTKIAIWLAEGAEISGFSNRNHVLQPSNTVANQPKAKLKGRARKLARDAVVAGKKAIKEVPQQYVVKTKDFVPMALAIASWHPPKVKPSAPILEIFRRTIAARKSCAVWYAAGSDGNESHQHFIRVLEEALNILKALVPKLLVDMKRSKPFETTFNQGVNNKFENLILEDTNGSDVDANLAQPARTSPKQPPSDLIYEQDETEKDEEFRFASYCLIKDLNDIRQYLLGLWQRYQRKEIDLVVAAATTNMAINLVRRAEREFATTAAWPKEYVAEWQDSPMAGCVPVIIVNGSEYGGKDSMVNSGWSATKSGAGIRLPQGMSEGREEWSFFRACLLLQCCDGPFPSRYSQVTNNPFVQDLMLLREIIPGIAAIARYCGQLRFMDELSCGLAVYMGMATDVSPPLWLIFATQILVDIHRVLASSPEANHRHLIEARLAHAHLLATFEKHNDVHESWPESLQHHPIIDDMARATANFASFFSGELEGKIEIRMKICATRRLRGLLPEASTDPVDILESNPILCGMIRYYCFLEMQRFGVDWANISRSIWSATHLYSALSVKDIDLTRTRKGPRMSRKEAAEAKLARNGIQEPAGASLLADFPVWVDIDLVVSHQGEEKMLVGGQPKTLEEAMKKWYLAQGYSVSTFAKGRRENTPLKQSSRSMRHLRSGSTIAQIFYRRCHHCDCDASMTVQDVEEVLNDRHARTKHTSDGCPLREPNHDQDCINPRANTHGGLSTLEMVETLEQGLLAEMPEILFDYFSMNHRCTQFFLELAADFKTKKKECWTEDFRSGRIEGVTATGRMIPEILRHACDLEKAPGLLPFKACYCINIEPLEIAREKLEELVLREGSVESEKMGRRLVSNGSAVSRAQMTSASPKKASDVKSANVREDTEECWSSVDEEELSDGEMFECPAM